MPQGFRTYIDSLPVIDTHEHIDHEWEMPKWNVLSDYTQHYFVRDLISSGLDPAQIPKLADPDRDILDKWDALEPYWENCRYTGYGQMLDLSVKRLYGVERLDRSTVETVEKGFQQLRAQPGHCRYILKEVCGIEHLLDAISSVDSGSEDGLFWYASQIDWRVSIDRGKFAREGAFAHIDRWVEHCLAQLHTDIYVHGAKGLKTALAYQRPLCYEETSRDDAQKAFEKWLGGEEAFAVIKPMQDYILHAILRWANEHRLLVQVHTGYQEGNGGYLPDANPVQLTRLILKYPNIRFDLFHMGYPYQDEIGAMGKMLPNVFLNMCWTHILAPVTAKHALSQWVQQVPLNKIFAFGGDCVFYDGIVGHLEMARRCVADVLSQQVASGLFTWKEAERIAKMLFYDNPLKCYTAE